MQVPPVEGIEVCFSGSRGQSSDDRKLACGSKANNVSGSDRSIIYNDTGGLRVPSRLTDHIVYRGGCEFARPTISSRSANRPILTAAVLSAKDWDAATKGRRSTDIQRLQSSVPVPSSIRVCQAVALEKAAESVATDHLAIKERAHRDSQLARTLGRVVREDLANWADNSSTAGLARTGSARIW